MDLLRMLLQVTLVAAMAAPTSAQAKPDCQDRCGNISIPYPFGTRAGCYDNPAFLVTCNNVFVPPKLFLSSVNIEITNISLDGQLQILQTIARICFDPLGSLISFRRLNITLEKFRISSTKNKFTAIGCDTRGSIVGKKDGRTYLSGCSLKCGSKDYVTNGSCSGIGCCQTSIPKGVSGYSVQLQAFNHSLSVWNFSPCSYAFVVEEDKFNFSSNYLSDIHEVEKLPVVLDWSIGYENCIVAARNSIGYACKANNSTCYEVDFGPGYRCNCSDGFRGNPYLLDGCQDIDECNDPTLNQCENSCENTVGNYTCSCPKWYHGDGRKDRSGCNPNILLVIEIVLGIGMGILLLSVGSSSLYWENKRRKQKIFFFKRNGGGILKEKVKTFTIEELKKATNDFAHKNIVGQVVDGGGFGTLYKGVLPENEIVAIKMALEVDESQDEQFATEVIVLSQINHQNVAKLLGCCLENQFPLLVYEFYANGNLFEHIHEGSNNQRFGAWEIRLRVAKEIAEALFYLHSTASIIHGDVKSTNIFLDDNFTAKISGFGVSRIVASDKIPTGPSGTKPLLLKERSGIRASVEACVCECPTRKKNKIPKMGDGALGYLDPEYHYTSQLSKQSDVFSFGVVLAELITSKKAVSNKLLLSTEFISYMNANDLSSILDGRLKTEDNDKQVLEVAKLAQCCLQLKGAERPTMKEVKKELEQLYARGKTPFDLS